MISFTPQQLTHIHNSPFFFFFSFLNRVGEEVEIWGKKGKKEGGGKLVGVGKKKKYFSFFFFFFFSPLYSFRKS